VRGGSRLSEGAGTAQEKRGIRTQHYVRVNAILECDRIPGERRGPCPQAEAGAAVAEHGGMKKEIVVRKELYDLLGDTGHNVDGKKAIMNEKGEVVPVRGTTDVGTLADSEYAILRDVADDETGGGGS
jgi:hypothetical protein